MTQGEKEQIGHFARRNGELFCEDVSLNELAEEVGTPTYVYSLTGIRDKFLSYTEALGDSDHLVCYSAKANSHIAIIRALTRKGAGLDIVSRGELYRAIQAGVDSRKIVFAGVGKREDEIRYALRNNILMFNVESLSELYKIEEIAQSMGSEARIALRINPDIDAKTHQYTATGVKESKFGFPMEQMRELLPQLREMKQITLLGLHSHIGSQIHSVEPYIQALEKMLFIVEEVREAGFPIEYLNLGGGMGVAYEIYDKPFTMEQWAQEVLPRLKNQELKLIIEPGRSLVAENGILLTRNIYIKKTSSKRFVITDAAMNDLIGPALYDDYHQIWPVVTRKDNNSWEIYDIVGPVCESGDFLGKHRELPRQREGDLLAIMTAGAYGMSMASHYNSRTLPAEVLVAQNLHHVIREREEIESLPDGEIIPPFL